MATIHPTAKERIIERLQRNGPCSLEDMVKFLHPTHSRSEMFAAIDQMLQDGRVTLREFGFLTYQLALLSPVVSPRSPSRKKEAHP